MNFVAFLVAVIIFALVGFGVDFDSVNQLQLTAFGLGFFALGHILPPGVPGR